MVAVVDTQLALYFHLAQLIGIRLHPHISDAGNRYQLANRLVAYERNLHEGLLLLAGDDEIAIGVAHASTEKGGILRVEQLDIGEFYRKIVIVYQSAYQLALALAYAFYRDEAVAHGHLHRIETNYLADSIGNICCLHVLGNCEVFQFVVDETDFVALGSFVEVDEDVRHAAVVIVALDVLCTHRQGERAQQEYDG